MAVVVRDIELDTDGDLLIVAGRDIQITSGTAAIRQNAELRLKKAKGAWFLDLDEGTDWLGRILGKGHSDAEIEDEIRGRLAATPGVVQVSSVTLTRDASRRTCRIVVEGQCDDGDAFEVDVEQVG